MPGRFVIGQDRVIRYAEVNPDYTQRPEPGDRPAPLGRPLRVGVGRHGRLCLQQQPLHHADLRLGGEAARDERGEVAGLQLGLARHLPRRRPAQRARQRLGAALVALPEERRRVGMILAAFFVAVFPGNLDQWLKHRKGFGLDSDTRRLGRLFFQPALVAAAIWSTRR